MGEWASGRVGQWGTTREGKMQERPGCMWARKQEARCAAGGVGRRGGSVGNGPFPFLGVRADDDTGQTRTLRGHFLAISLRATLPSTRHGRPFLPPPVPTGVRTPMTTLVRSADDGTLASMPEDQRAAYMARREAFKFENYYPRIKELTFR